MSRRRLYAQRMPRNVSVIDYLDELDHRHADAVVALRQLILDAVPGIQERIKWNAPSFGPADDDRVTMRLQPRDCLELVLHRGVAVKDASRFSFDDPAGLVVWRSRDRGVVTLAGLSDVEAQRDSLSDLVRRWVAATAA